jgi:hypothetical protein
MIEANIVNHVLSYLVYILVESTETDRHILSGLKR